MVYANVTMRIAEYSLILCSLFLMSNGLNCRSEGGLKENEVKNVYNACLKQQNKSNGNNDGDQDWKETRRYNQWSKDDAARNRGNVNNRHRMDGQHAGNRMNNRDRNEDRHKTNRQDDRSKNRDNRMEHRDRDEDEDNMYSRGENQNRNGDSRSQRNNGVSGRNDFFQNENVGGYGNNQYSTQSPRRYKRERRIEVNSGKRSQYNPNSQRFSGYDDKYNKHDDGKNSSESNSTTEEDSKACAVHCLLEKLQMTGEHGMPDRYLVTHTITKGVKDEDLNDFLQESIEECFQILNNENSDDKCEFSKNLLMCLSEKGRANCDDWKDDYQF